MKTESEGDMKAELKTEPCIAIASKLQLLDCALQDSQRQVEIWDTQIARLQAELTEARQQAEADASTAAEARQIMHREIRDLKEKLAAAKSAIAIADDERDELERENRSLKERLDSQKPSRSCLPLRAWKGWWR